ncbi:MAG TPA: aminoglycoside phosphotransferase family protein [Gemmatimonadaceae bacterium]|nr:aminoglycoside phosphotransferase family protein [Gemmatimonadaceae bacterium]
MIPFSIPANLASSCARSPVRATWLDVIPRVIGELTTRWSLKIAPPFEGDDVSCAWVAPATRRDGTSVVLKLGMPHFEGEQEIAGLRLLKGYPTVHLLEADENLNAMLLERCIPGTSLRALAEPEQDVIIAGLLRRFWRPPPSNSTFGHLSEMLTHWSEETRRNEARWHDAGLVRAGLRTFEEMGVAAASDVLLVTDLHAGNVLRAEREPWLVIDPKPFVGDRAYDATQHLLNCRERLRSRPDETIKSVADLLEVDHERVWRWTFARLAAEPRDNWDDESTALARIVDRQR